VRTIGELWREAIGAGRTRPAYLVEHNDGWEEVSWDEAGVAVEELANGLLALGVRKGDVFGILAQTSLEWALFDYALARVGAVGAAIYANSSPNDCRYVLEHSDAIGVLVEDEGQQAKIGDVPLAHVLTFAGLDDLRARGREFAASDPNALAEAEAQVGEDDLFTFIYTSGTTGPPKACMIRHRNYYEMATCIDRVPEFALGEDVMLLYLPLAHNFGRLMHLLGAHTGYTTAFCPDPLRVAEAMPAVRPTLLPSVPRLYEKVHTAVVAQFEQVHGPRRRLLDWALAVGRRVSLLRQRGEPIPRGLALKHRLADRLVYSKVKNRLGGRLRLGISGGAPLAKEIAEFFHSIDILIIEGWGLTECTTAASVNRPSHFRFGTVGPALPGCEVRVGEDGELLIRSPTVFAGYYKDEEATREALGERLAALWRRRRDRRGRFHHDHRPQEGHPDHGRRQERGAREPGERAQDGAAHLTGARARRPASVRGGADHRRSGDCRRAPAGGGRAPGAGGRRRRERRASALRTNPAASSGATSPPRTTRSRRR
jgi:long-chain acyl-CoA synthetase